MYGSRGGQDTTPPPVKFKLNDENRPRTPRGGQLSLERSTHHPLSEILDPRM